MYVHARPRSFTRSDDTKIVCSRDRQCNTEESPLRKRSRQKTGFFVNANKNIALGLATKVHVFVTKLVSKEA